MISPEMLRRFTLFAGIGHQTLKNLAMLSHEVLLKKGEWLFEEGDDADNLYLIISGSLELKVKLQTVGEYSDITNLVEGDLAGWSAVVEPYVFRLGAMALTDVRVVAIDAAGLRDLMIENPTVGFQMMQRLTQIMGKRLSDVRIQLVSLVGV